MIYSQIVTHNFYYAHLTILLKIIGQMKKITNFTRSKIVAKSGIPEETPLTLNAFRALGLVPSLAPKSLLSSV